MTAFIALGPSSFIPSAHTHGLRSGTSPPPVRHHQPMRRPVTRRPARVAVPVPASFPCRAAASDPGASGDDAPAATTTTMTSSDLEGSANSNTNDSDLDSSTSKTTTASTTSQSSSPSSSTPSPSPSSSSDDSSSSSATPTATASAQTQTSGPVRVPATEISDAEKTAFRAKYEHLRGTDVETVSDMMQRFTMTFKRPVPIVYRTVINETLSTTHLARVCPMWRYDAIFALGFDAVFSTFLKYYPNVAERDALYDAAATALRFSPADLRADAAAATAAIVDGSGMKTEAELFNALDATPSAANATNGILEAMSYIRDSVYGEWYYSRLFGIGLITIMDLTNTSLDATTAEKWAIKLGVESSKFGAEMGAYLSGLERLKQAEQIYAEATAREAKKTAERLAAKAKKAAEEAALLEGSADGAEQKGDDADGGDATGTESSASSAETPKA